MKSCKCGKPCHSRVETYHKRVVRIIRPWCRDCEIKMAESERVKRNDTAKVLDGTMCHVPRMQITRVRSV